MLLRKQILNFLTTKNKWWWCAGDGGVSSHYAGNHFAVLKRIKSTRCIQCYMSVISQKAGGKSKCSYGLYFLSYPHFSFMLSYSLVVQMIKNLPAMWETWVWSLGWEHPLEEGMATHSSILAWRIPWTEEPGGLQSMGSQRVGHDWATKRTQKKTMLN